MGRARGHRSEGGEGRQIGCLRRLGGANDYVVEKDGSGNEWDEKIVLAGFYCQWLLDGVSIMVLCLHQKQEQKTEERMMTALQGCKGGSTCIYTSVNHCWN